MGSLRALFSLVKNFAEFVPVLLKLGFELYKAYQAWKDRHPDAPKPATAFVESKVLNSQTTPSLAIPSTLKPPVEAPKAVKKAIQKEEEKRKSEADTDRFKAILDGKTIDAEPEPFEEARKNNK